MVGGGGGVGAQGVGVGVPVCEAPLFLPPNIVFPLGLGFRQLGARTFLMVSTITTVHTILIGDSASTDKKVGVAPLSPCCTANLLQFGRCVDVTHAPSVFYTGLAGGQRAHAYQLKGNFQYPLLY